MSSNRARRAFGFRVGQVAGIDIHVDLSLAIVFALITFSLGNGLFPSWHPDWSLFVTWATALAAAFSFFVSILIHELSHGDGELNGLIRREDILKWLSLYGKDALT
jgi:hypothetical protein